MLNVEAPFELVGRSRELAKATKALEKAARARMPTVMRIAGNAGIGKTLFAEHVALHASQQGWLVLDTTCHELQRNTPFVATTRLLLSFLRQMPDASRYTSGLEAALASLDPAIALRFEREASPTPSKARYQEIFLRFFDGVGTDYKIFLLCDDAQWMDADSRNVIEALAAAYVVGPLAVVFASRRTGDESAAAGTTHIDLLPLNERDAQALALTRFPKLPAVAIDAAVEHGNGIPFEIITLCEELEEGHAISEDTGDHRVLDLIASRIAGMEPREREFMQICSLLGEPIEYRMLFALYSPADVAALVSGAARPYLMADGAALRFRHALVGDAIRTTVEFDVPLRRRIIEALQGLKDKAFADYERIAEHALACDQPDVAQQAYLDLAGAAFTRLAWSTALAAHEAALSVGQISKDQFVRFFTTYTYVLRITNRDAKAADVIYGAVQQAQSLEIRRGVGTLLSALIATLWGLGRSDDAVSVYHSFLPMLEEPKDRAMVAASLMNVAAFSYNVDGFRQAEQQLAETRSDDRQALATAHSARAILLSAEGNHSEALKEADLGVATADSAARQDELKSFGRIMVVFRGEGCKAAESDLTVWLQRNRVDGRIHDLGAGFKACISVALADWENAYATAKSALQEAPSTNARSVLLSVPALIAALREDRDGFDEFRKDIRDQILSNRMPDCVLQLAPWYLSMDADAEVELLFEECLRAITERPPSPHEFGFVPLGIVRASEKRAKKRWRETILQIESTKDRSKWAMMQWSLARGTDLQSAIKAARELDAPFYAAYAEMLTGKPSATAKSLLQQLGVADAQAAASYSSGPLSRREREVAALVADGKTNRAIAENLFLSERTVERHLGNIFDKLQLSSRAQLVRWIVQANLT